MFPFVYARRLGVWASIARQIRGETPADSVTLRRAILRAPLTSLRNPHEWQNPWVDRDCRVTTSVGSFHVRARSDDLYLTLPTREAAIVSELRRSLLPGDCFIDAGANIGFFSVLASKLVGPAGHVIAIEMMPDTASILRRHLAENQCTNVQVVEAALSDASGETKHATVTPGKFGQASIIIEQQGSKVGVSTVTLAEILKDRPLVRVMKLDIEGAELAALRGLGNSLDKVRSIVFEDWGRKSEAASWLKDRGYSVVRLDSVNSLAIRPDPS